ncbi:restriction endonuclease subunit S, partial [Lacicoccus alkaliphilus]
RRITILQRIKQQYLSLMFPKNDINIPQLRFKGFKEKWVHNKFFDNITTLIDFRGKTPKKLGMEWSDTGYLALSALNVKNGYIDKTIEAKYGSEKLYKKWMGDKHLSKGLVLFTTEAPMGNVALVPDNEKYILSQRTLAFDTDKSKMTNLFLATTLRTSTVQNKLLSLSSGATAKGVSQKSLSALDITIPKSLEEQNNIGLIINLFDKNIKLSQQKLDTLYMIKKVYLHKMFI